MPIITPHFCCFPSVLDLTEGEGKVSGEWRKMHSEELQIKENETGGTVAFMKGVRNS
jgi:hypothetical protein